MFRSGYVTILGEPNVGKSTLINALIGEKLAIVSHKPQTTRHRILGILNRPSAQILFLDTPGIHSSTKRLNELMVESALRTLGDADVILHLILPSSAISEPNREIASRCKQTRKPYFVLINKVDQVAKEALLPLMQKVQTELQPHEIIPISALQGDGVPGLIEQVEKRLPEGPAYYPQDIYTEHDTRFLCAELVREKATRLLHQELPYALMTQVEAYEEGEKLDRIHIAIIVEKPSQKAMVIGAKGQMIKKIGEQARVEIQKMLGKKIYLELFVKVEEKWTQKEDKLKELGLKS